MRLKRCKKNYFDILDTEAKQKLSFCEFTEGFEVSDLEYTDMESSVPVVVMGLCLSGGYADVWLQGKEDEKYRATLKKCSALELMTRGGYLTSSRKSGVKGSRYLVVYYVFTTKDFVELREQIERVKHEV